MDELVWGARLFGLVVGWVTYYTLAHSSSHGIKDVAVVVGTIGGAAVLALFPAQTKLFGAYGVGLAVGFFLYWGILFIAPFFALGWKGGWGEVSKWTSRSMLMYAGSTHDAGPPSQSQRTRKNG